MPTHASKIEQSIVDYRQPRRNTQVVEASAVEAAVEGLGVALASYERPDGTPTPWLLDMAESLAQQRNAIREWVLKLRKSGMPEDDAKAMIRGFARRILAEHCINSKQP